MVRTENPPYLGDLRQASWSRHNYRSHHYFRRSDGFSTRDCCSRRRSGRRQCLHKAGNKHCKNCSGNVEHLEWNWSKGLRCARVYREAEFLELETSSKFYVGNDLNDSNVLLRRLPSFLISVLWPTILDHYLLSCIRLHLTIVLICTIGLRGLKTRICASH